VFGMLEEGTEWAATLRAQHDWRIARSDKRDLDGALPNYDEAIHLKPDYATAQSPPFARTTATRFALPTPCVPLFSLLRRIVPAWPAARPCRARTVWRCSENAAALYSSLL